MMTVTNDVQTTDAQVYALDQLNGLSNVSKLEFLRMLDALDKREAWREDGARSVEDWVAYRYSWSSRTAFEHVRTMRALRELPEIADAFGHGHLPWEIVVDLCTFVTAADDEEWAARAQHSNAATIKRYARAARRLRKEDAAIAQGKRFLDLYWDEHKALLRLNGVIPGSEGAAVKKAIERIAERYGPEPDGTWLSFDQRRADALVELAGTHIAQDADADRATVVIHVGLAELNHINGSAKLEDGPMVPSEVARKLSCDARLQFSVYDPNGFTVGIGRVSQSISPWLRREVKQRDQTCVVCGTSYAHQVHHLIHYAHGGPTDLDNLVLLCRRCHTKVHDEGFRLVKDQYGTWRLVRPDGRPVMNRPAHLRPEVRERMLGPGRGSTKARVRPPARC